MVHPKLVATAQINVQVEKGEIAKYLRDMATRYIRSAVHPDEISIAPLGGTGAKVIIDRTEHMLTYSPEALIYLEAAQLLEKK